MINIAEKTINDLQFPTLLETLSSICNTDIGKQKALEIKPFNEKEDLMEALLQTSEYVSSFQNNNAIPNHGFETINHEIKFLAIEDSFLEVGSFRKIANISITVNILLLFFKKFEEYYPNLNKRAIRVEYTKEIIALIEDVVDKYGEIKDNASVDLLNIRRNMNTVRGKVNQSFGIALTQYNSLGYLDDIKESFVQNRRVLAVLSMYRRKVKGSILGSSKTGSIAYIEPETTLNYSRELSNLEYEEKEEITKILKYLTDRIRPYLSLIIEYQEFLSDIDVTAAKAKYAVKINAILPTITDERRVFFKDAFHPILYLNNKENKLVTYPQTIELDSNNRIIVISGPNAGGKTISLKTVGLLQLMFQSGMLIPVHERSETFLFDRILTDIGDNQSIENHLSTYSYRLKNMNYFLKKCNSKTLFLIDEFGTGSDPELGGALAEIFLEEFYNREAFGIITTHYSNLKILANELPFAMNANMLFDEKSLEPMYKLVLGQAGSSFTFEVASINGIPADILKAAKQRLSVETKRFNELLSTLQQEKRYLQKMIQEHKNAQEGMVEELRKVREQADFYTRKTKVLGTQSDEQAKWIQLGQRMEKYLNRFNPSPRKRKENEALMEEIRAFFLKSTVKPTVKKPSPVKKKPAHSPVSVVFNIGDKVRMAGTKQVGIIEAIDKSKAHLLVNNMKISVPLDKLLPF